MAAKKEFKTTPLDLKMNQGYFITIIAEPLKINGRKCFVFKEDGCKWNVSDCYTGALISSGRYKKDAVSLASMNISKATNQFDLMIETLNELGIKHPVND